MRRDAELKPRLFFWEGAISRTHLKGLIDKQGWTLPSDLFNLLTLTGGGEIFESETILGPFRDADLGDNLFTYNEELRGRGLPEGYVVFHTGMAVSAVRLIDGRYVELGLDNFHEREEFESLEDWYLRLIRAEYAERYGLSTQVVSPA
jgi:hypothetical protein